MRRADAVAVDIRATYDESPVHCDYCGPDESRHLSPNEVVDAVAWLVGDLRKQMQR